MKTRFIIASLITGILFSACTYDEISLTNTRTISYHIVPFKGATISLDCSIPYGGYYLQEMLLSMNDTTTAHNKIDISLNGNEIISTTDKKWSCTIDSSKLQKTSLDSLFIHIEHSGHSDRYGWNYNRQKDGYALLNRKGVYSWSTNMIPHASYSHFSIPNDTLKHTYYNSIALTYTASYIEYGTDYIGFSPEGGNQLEIVVEYPEENSYYDNISIWYGDVLLDTVPHGKWRKRYYLDEFPSGEKVFLKSVQNGHENCYNIIEVND